MGPARTPASSGGKDLLSSWPSGNPTDASGTFRSNPRPSTKAFIPLFHTAKLLRIFLRSLPGLARENVLIWPLQIFMLLLFLMVALKIGRRVIANPPKADEAIPFL